MNIKLIGLDLDGTLFDNEKKISPANMAALGRAAAAGIFAVPVTGRPLNSLPAEFKEKCSSEYAVTTNGAAVYNLKSGECVYRDCMSAEKAITLLNTVDKYNTATCCFSHGAGYMDEERLKIIPHMNIPETTKDYFRTDMIFVKNLNEYIEKNLDCVEKLAVNFDMKDGVRVGGEEALLELSKTVGITVVSGEKHNYEITCEGTTKATGLIKLGEILGIKMEDIMAFGDDCNDLDMIKRVGFGVAMENAMPEVKAAAKYVTKSNENDGVAYAVNKFIFGGN